SPLKLFEYMACEKPVLASKVKGFEFLEAEGCGLLASPEDPEAVAKAILKMLSDKEKLVEMGKRGRKLVVERYTWEASARQIGTICRQVVSSI
ncbi:MAG: glycosyltransferase, partial [Candidatus Thermoplasmatota archaeon]|nr:glycosyltransferase [Candidatus Thermoplasmatota archaeon]